MVEFLEAAMQPYLIDRLKGVYEHPALRAMNNKTIATYQASIAYYQAIIDKETNEAGLHIRP